MSRSAARRNPQRRRSTIQLFIYNANSKIKEQFMQDERFHPTVIGVILLLFLFSVSAFVSHMEGLSYFDSFYACFVTYSSIGFGDLDIFVSNSLSKFLNIFTKNLINFPEGFIQIWMVSYAILWKSDSHCRLHDHCCLGSSLIGQGRS